MVYNRFRVQIAARIGLLALTIAAAVVLLFQGPFLITAGVLFLWAVLQVVLMFHYLERTERDVAHFFESVAYDAYDIAAPASHSPLAARLHGAFARIMQDFRQVRAQREDHYQYLQTVVRHIGTGLITFDESGRIDLCNEAALHLFALDSLHHLNQLESFGAELPKTLLGLTTEDTKTVHAHTRNGPIVLALHSARFRRNSTNYTLVSLQNISQELEEKEMEAWQSILRAMTHEIRNSMTPIGSLASTALQMLESPLLSDDPLLADDVRLALRTIERRSQSLLRFVDAFRTLAHLPVPVKQKVIVQELMNHLRTLFQLQLAQKIIGSRFEAESPDLVVWADPALLEQVLINLILNAQDALDQRSNGQIEVLAGRDEWGRVRFRVADNGPGIPEDVQEKAFVPFFSTKPAGSGMGLSLSRLILRLHGASIYFHSIPNVRTTFEIVFPVGGS